MNPAELPPPKANPKAWVAMAGKAVLAVFIMCLGAGYGIGAYSVFAGPHWLGVQKFGSSALMLVSFLAGIPFAIGLLVGYGAKRKKLVDPAGASALSLVALGLFLFAAGAFLREGTVCIVMATPFFVAWTLLGALAGVLINALDKWSGRNVLSVGLLMPFFLAPVESQLALTPAVQTVTRSVQIEAPPQLVWQHINYPLNIQPSELKNGFAYRIGVPYPIEARTLEGRVGGKRRLRWQRGIQFDEVITAWQPNVHVAWDYQFGPDSFPAGSLDDHVVIGGRYFTLNNTSYTLKPEAQGTRLTIHVTATVTTTFNAYAGLWATYLLDDTAAVILDFYKARSERKGASPAPV